jgi:tetratricopeptide (TPR) repeat protein
VAAILIFFLLLEGGLALFGVKPALQTEDPFVGFASNVPLFVPSPDGRQLVTAPNKLNFFNPQSFPREKAPGTYRIFCLGASTTYGHPYTDPTSFAGWMRELLPAADVTKHWEVINAGGISYASYRVAHLMEELVNYQPDLFVIYTGQNEFLEERTYGKLRDVPAAVRTSVALLARTRTWSGMTAALKGLGVYPEAAEKGRDQLAGEVDAILERTAGLDRYRRDDPLRDNILQHYRISLERMVALARSAGAQVIFVTPATNLKDCSPFKSEHTAGLDPEKSQRSEQMLAEAREAIRKEDWNGALGILDAAVALDPRHAELLYRRGQVLLALGRFDEAESALRQARDEDVCPLRALTPMPQIVAEVARDEGVGLVDYIELLRRRMQSEKGHPILGEEYFLDHVHPTIEGYKILAVALIQEMIDQGLVQSGAGWGEQAISAVTAKVESRIDHRAHGQALAVLARTLLWAGKTEDAERLAGQALEVAGDVQQVAVDAASILTTVYQAQGEPGRALQLMYSALERAPGAIELRLKLGYALLNPPFLQLEEAAANLLLVCQQMPHYDVAHQLFGQAMAKRGNIRIGYASLQEALRLNPNNSDAKMTLAQIRPYLGTPPPSSQLPRIMVEIYPTGAPRKLVQVSPDANGRIVPDGIEVDWHENGRLKRFQDFDLGVRHGLDLTWDTNGRLVSRLAFADGKPIDLGPGQ